LANRFASLTCLLFVICATLLRANDASTIGPDTSWQKVDEKGGVTIYARKRLGTGVKEFKGTGIIDAPPQAVEKVLEDVANYPSFMPYVAEARVISQSGDETVTYQRLELPVVSNRDYTVRVEHGSSQNPNGLMIYRDTWQTDNEAGPPERHGTVRVNVNEGSWLLEPAGPGGASTQATYQIYTDSGGALPAFVANHASETVIPKLFEAIRKQVRAPKYGTP
jgi:hypothetical protein